MGYDKGKFNLSTQSLVGVRSWDYYDTGGETVAGYTASGFFADANDKGVSVDDPIRIVDAANGIVYTGKFTVVQDTGATQGTVSLDTGNL